MKVTFDILLFFHLFIYPLAAGSFIASAVWTWMSATNSSQRIFSVIVWLIGAVFFILAFVTHIEYQGYMV